MTTKKSLVILIVAIIIGVRVFAQEEKTERLAQISFICFGTNGVKSVDYNNKFSLNIIAGMNGGVNGLELGSVLNMNKGMVKGCQIAGVSNLTLGNSSGAIISGVLNVSTSHKGLQLSTINVVSEKMTGAQMGVINVASKKMDGSQIGIINVTKEAKGMQIGIINFANNTDSIIPVGLINIVKNGYYAVELSTNELFLSNLSFKMGVEKFYTFFRAGIGSFNKEPLFTTGGGLGSIISIKNKHKFNIELISDQIVYDNNWNEGLNLLNQLCFTYQYQITDFLAVKGGPCIKNYATDQKVDGKFNTLKVPYTILESTTEKVKSSTWIGFNAGIVISF